jgi:hypothetical protein
LYRVDAVGGIIRDTDDARRPESMTWACAQ